MVWGMKVKWTRTKEVKSKWVGTWKTVHSSSSWTERNVAAKVTWYHVLVSLLLCIKKHVECRILRNFYCLWIQSKCDSSYLYIYLRKWRNEIIHPSLYISLLLILFPEPTKVFWISLNVIQTDKKWHVPAPKAFYLFSP